MKEVLKLDHIKKVLWEWWNYHKGDRGHQLLRSGRGICGDHGRVRFRQDYLTQLHFHH